MKDKQYDFSDFDEKQESKQYDFSDFDSPKEEPGILETIAAKAANGISLGFLDEFSGGLEAAGRVAGVKGLGGKLSDVGLSEDGPTLDSEKLTQAYREARDNKRKLQDDMSKAHPVVSGVSEVAGGIAGTIATLPAAAASFAGRTATAAGLGAVAGLGNSQADLTEDDYLGAAKDAAIGGVLGAGMNTLGEKVVFPLINKGAQYVPKIAEKIDDGINWATKKVGKGLFGVDEKATENYLRNPEAVNKAYSLGELADTVLNQADDSSVLNEMRKKTSGLSAEDWDNLGRNTDLSKEDLLSLGEDFVKKIIKGKDGTLTRTKGTGADADAIKAIYKQLDEISEAYGDNLSEADLKSIIKGMQEKAFGSDVYAQTKVQQLSGIFNDALKRENPIYAKSIKNTEEATKALKQVKGVFQNRNNPENYDKFNSTIKNLVNKDEMSAANQAVKKIQEHTGYDLKQDIVDSWTKNQFSKGDINGSRKTLLGGMIGTAAGSIVGNPITGGAIGAGIGHTVDKYAGNIFKKVLDGRISAHEFSNTIAPHMGKFSKPLIDAASRGNKAIVATHFILQQKYPEYRKLIQDNDK